MPTLYAFAASEPSRACLWFIEYAELKGIDVTVVNPLKHESRTPEYLAKFPEGHVPAFEDGDFVFSESSAILEYLADGHAILPKDKKEKALLQMYFGGHEGNIRKFTHKIILPVIGAKSADDSDAALAKGIEEVAPILQKYESQLAKHKYIIGDTLTLADFMFATEVDQLEWVKPGYTSKTYPNISAYVKAMDSITGYTKTAAAAHAILKAIFESRGF